MAINRFWRRGRATACRRRAAPVLPEAGLSGPARRVNQLVAVLSLAGACGSVALAIALTPGAQTSASSAKGYPGDLTISRIEAPQAVPAPKGVAAVPDAGPVQAPARGEFEAEAHTIVVASRPEPAPKSDRLAVERQMSRFEPADKRGDTDVRGAVRDGADEHDAAKLAAEPTAGPAAAREAVDSAERKLDADDLDTDDRRSLEFGLSEPPPPGATSENAGAEDVEEASADADAAVEAVVDDAVEQAAPEQPEPEQVEAEQAQPEQVEPEQVEPEQGAAETVAATRTAPVRTDVNMRARPSNGAAVIQVVPGNSNVEVIGCDYWCEVLYDGRRGFIYKGFVRGS